jgi:hypothetical protein
MQRRPAAALAAAALAAAIPLAAPAQEADANGDLLTVAGAMLYPVQLMAYCYGVVAEDPLYRAAGLNWTDRNTVLVGRVEAKAAAAGIPQEARLAADRAALAAIREVVGGQGDKPAYCTLMASVIEAGHFDLDQRDDLRAPLKRIFTPS